MARHVKAIILAIPVPQDWKWEKARAPDTNTRCLTAQHITSAVALPTGHTVRAILAAAAVEGCLRLDDYPFKSEAANVPGFFADLLTAMRATLESIDLEYDESTFRDHINGVRLKFTRT